MGQTTAIAWTDATQNFWQGCKKVSTGCKFCYMYRDKERYGADPALVVRSADATFYAPLRKRSFQKPQRVFTCSWSDFFIEEADGWRPDAWWVMKRSPHLTYQILTKRPERLLQCLPPDWGETGYPNVWLGVTVEDQASANLRLPMLRHWRDRMDNILFVSFEPLLGPIDLYRVLASDYIGWNEFRDIQQEWPFHWAILGGESGNEQGNYRYRPCEIGWLTDLTDQLVHNKVAVFVKQLGTSLAKRLGLTDRHGTDPAEWSAHLRIQQFPDE